MKPSFLESPSVAWWETSAVRRRDSCDESESPPVAGLGDLDRSVEVNAFDLGFLIGVGDTDGAIVEGSDFDGDDIVNSNDLGLLSGALVSCRMKVRPRGKALWALADWDLVSRLMGVHDFRPKGWVVGMAGVSEMPPFRMT